MAPKGYILNRSALLVLEDGTVFHGKSIGADGTTTGEIVFNTSMTGYQEILTDPSYAKQMVTLTYPHIGNVGINREDEESGNIFCSGLIVKHVPRRYSNWRSEHDLPTYLKNNNVIAISDIDTRKLTRHIRLHGALRSCLVAGELCEVEKAIEMAKDFPGLGGMDLAKEVSTPTAYKWAEGVWDLKQGHKVTSTSRFNVVACDFGVKRNILRLLSDRGCAVTVLPATASYEEIMSHRPDGVFLSNGPGDPEPCDYAVSAISKLLDHNVPIFGICLGHQLLSLASGASTQKMKFGHHGANHPVQDLETGQVLITSQNHGFTVDESSIGDNLKITHRSLFDNTIQGLERIDKPAFSFQGHPEASPGPRDLLGLFDRFISVMTSHKGTANA
ncbi:MAG: glutamine-hydrolyzing carbamoyl-phosphate synthase small subunit [Gammaproteobacteria bacterium]|nr:glutamine-hydrolyzing carbamoyl-phosphate synthase small subunit [Gammaproteobacteria bacterium]